MRLSFRHRLFAGLVLLGAAPLAVALVILALQANASSSPAGPRAALEEIAASSRTLAARMDTLALSPEARTSLQEHADVIARRTTLARRAEAISRMSAGVLAVLVSVSGLGLVAGSVYLAQRWSRSFARPIENLIGWIRRIERGEPLPSEPSNHDTPEVEALAVALRDMARELESARARELEQQRLLAFREVARRVAHELRGPLTASQLALAQLHKDPEATAATEAVKVLKEETARLERMAREFAEFGRLPEGPRTEIDISELVASVVAATVPPDVPVTVHCGERLTLAGQYEPLRRALQNLIRNAVEATDSRGIEVHALQRSGRQGIDVRIVDHGSGIAESDREKIFEPYVTTKTTGTGLGLAIARQVAAAHSGTILVESDGDGATFILRLPNTVE